MRKLTSLGKWLIVGIAILLIWMLMATIMGCRTIHVDGPYQITKEYGVVKDNKIEMAKKKVPETLPEKLQEILRKTKSLEGVIGKSKLAGISWVYLRELIKIFEKYDILQGDLMPKRDKK